MSPRKRRGPALTNRPSQDSITTTALEGLSLSLSKHWVRYQEDQAGDFWESPDLASVLMGRRATRDCVGCGCVPRYVDAA
jgi:hypothetical protein